MPVPVAAHVVSGVDVAEREPGCRRVEVASATVSVSPQSASTLPPCGQSHAATRACSNWIRLSDRSPTIRYSSPSSTAPASSVALHPLAERRCRIAAS